MKIKLKDGTKYICTESSTSKLVLFIYDSSTILEIVDKMTKENLSEFKYLDDLENVVGIYTGKISIHTPTKGATAKINKKIKNILVVYTICILIVQK